MSKKSDRKERYFARQAKLDIPETIKMRAADGNIYDVPRSLVFADKPHEFEPKNYIVRRRKARIIIWQTKDE